MALEDTEKYAQQAKEDLNPIFRISCSTSVRLISYPLQGTMTTGQRACYKTGQPINAQLRMGLLS